MATETTVAEALVARLAAEGVETAFGIPGKQTLPLNEAMDDVRFVVARHETAVTHQAWGYAETTGEPAATVVVPGPGDLNAANGLKNASNDCTPLVHIAVETDPAVRGGDAIHETPPGVYDDLVKANRLVERPQGAVATLTEAIRTARTPPKGPVRVGVPEPLLSETVPQAAPPAADPPGPLAPDAETVAEAARLLGGAAEPVVVAGGGVRASGATPDLRTLAERLDAPVVTTYKGKGTLPETHPLSAGVFCGGTSPELAALVADADAALAVGTDLDAVAFDGWDRELPPVVHVTLGVGDIGTGYDPAVALVADAGATLRALSDRLSEREGRGHERARAVRESDAARIDRLVDGEVPLTSPGALAAVRAGVPAEATVAVDAGGFRIWALVAFPAAGPRSYVNPGSWASMGTGVPSAIGAAVAAPDEDVVALTGDGGLLMCLHELHTLAAEGIDATVVVFRNDDYAIISEAAERAHGLDAMAYGWPDAPIAFTDVAAGLGVAARRAETPEAVEAAVANAVAADEPRLIEVPTDPEEPQASEWMRR